MTATGREQRRTINPEPGQRPKASAKPFQHCGIGARTLPREGSESGFSAGRKPRRSVVQALGLSAERRGARIACRNSAPLLGACESYCRVSGVASHMRVPTDWMFDDVNPLLGGAPGMRMGRASNTRRQEMPSSFRPHSGILKVFHTPPVRNCQRTSEIHNSEHAAINKCVHYVDKWVVCGHRGGFANMR